MDGVAACNTHMKLHAFIAETCRFELQSSLTRQNGGRGEGEEMGKDGQEEERKAQETMATEERKERSGREVI